MVALPEEEAVVLAYCMAPRQVEKGDGTAICYSRARIIKLDDGKKLGAGDSGHKFCYVFFVDHAFGQWVSTRCLGKLPYELCTIPWQAVPICLMGVRPFGNGLHPNGVSVTLPHYQSRHT